ncbi:MAG TPA: Gfo/Idh/MocA family oxidoreductase [Galbitalea sp.]|jgi:myo-inositol 2-dehydrogenase/D-chiro-inositol 1-dehydrogenase
MVLKVGIIGAGGISHSHAPHWVTVGAEVSVYSEVGAESLANEFGLSVASSLDDLFENVDVVDICTPTTTHAAIAVAAIEAGKHVLCEKPIGRTTAQANAVADAAHKHGRQAYPAHVVRFFPEYVALKSAVERGQIGDIAVARYSRGGEGATSEWFFDDALSGGIIIDQMIHDIDQARWIAGEVVRVFARQNPPTVDGAVPRNVVAHVTLTHASGAISFIQGVWGPRGMQFRTSFDVAGTDGTLRFDSTSPAASTVDENLTSVAIESSYLPPTSAEESPYLTQIREFAAAFEGGPPPRVTIEDGVLAVAIAEAARESIARGAAVEFDADAVLGSEGALA